MTIAATAAENLAAEFTQSRNDMAWTVYAGPDGFVRWSGYDDAYWWNNVSKSEAARTRTGKQTGRTFVIDFGTGEVTVSQPAEQAA